MGEGVSLPRSGVTISSASHRSLVSLVISVPFSREQGFYGKANLLESHGFSSSFYVSSGGSYLPEVRMAIGARAWIHKWSNEDFESVLSTDLLETDLSGVLPSRSMGEPVLPILGCAFVALVLPMIRADLVVRARARVVSNPGGYFSWVTDLLSAGSFYPERFVGYMGGRHLGSLGCIRASARLVPGNMGQSLSPVEAVKATANGEKGRMNQFERACSWVSELGLAESRVPDPGGSKGLSGFSIVDGQATLMKKKTSGIEHPIGWSGFSVNVGSKRGYFPDLVDANNGIQLVGILKLLATEISGRAGTQKVQVTGKSGCSRWVLRLMVSIRVVGSLNRRWFRI